MTDARATGLCDVRGCQRAVEHTTFDMNPDLSIKEQVDLCAYHARLLCDFEDLDDSMSEGER